MIQFQGGVEKHGSTRLESLDNFKDIKSMDCPRRKDTRLLGYVSLKKEILMFPMKMKIYLQRFLVGQVMSFILISIWGRSSVRT